MYFLLFWGAKCLNSSFSPSEIKDFIRFAEDCKTRRIEFTDQCCGGKTDVGHSGAIKRMDDIVSACKYQLNLIQPSRPRW